MELINAREMHAIQTETGKENQKFAEFATGIELATPGSAVRLTSVARLVTDCAMRPGKLVSGKFVNPNNIENCTDFFFKLNYFQQKNQ